MAVAPVLIGATAAAAAAPATQDFAYVAGAWASDFLSPGTAMVLTAVLALIVSLALQVGVNYANDYSDGIRGTDDARVGPMRLTGSGAAQPRQVKRAAFASFGVAALAGLGIVLLTGQWWLIGAGALCVLAAWWYTGGSKPYGYMGLGEIMVFIFFGLVATLGTTYAMVAAATVRGVSTEFPVAEALIGAVSHGLIASALLMANNVRDIPTDRESGKITLAVRLGDQHARLSYVLMVGLAVVLPLGLLGQSLWFLLVAISWLLCAGPARIMLNPGQTGPQLIKVLQLTGLIGIAFALTYSTALLLA